MNEVKVIKRYQNRKLYDTQESSYVTLDQIAKMIKAGEEVQVVDNQTKKDITAATLTQLLYEKERKLGGQNQNSIILLKEIIRHGDGSFSSYIESKVGSLRTILGSSSAEVGPDVIIEVPQPSALSEGSQNLNQ